MTGIKQNKQTPLNPSKHCNKRLASHFCSKSSAKSTQYTLHKQLSRDKGFRELFSSLNLWNFHHQPEAERRKWKMRYLYTQKLAHITSTHIPLSKNRLQAHAKEVWKIYSLLRENGRTWKLVSTCLVIYSLLFRTSRTCFALFPCIGQIHFSSRKATQSSL